jgi:hypothetical protein
MKTLRARASLALSALTLVAGLVVHPGVATAGALNPIPQNRSVDAVVLQGSAFAAWSAGPEVTARRPHLFAGSDAQGVPVPKFPWNSSDCATEPGSPFDPSTDHNCNQKPDAALYGTAGVSAGGNDVASPKSIGKPVNQILGFAWTDSGFQQIPLQVDERFTRYLSNTKSGFAFYSGTDQHLTYAFDREGFRFTWNDLSNPCLATAHPGPHGAAQKDPIQGLDDNDEIVFMYRDAGKTQAPAGTSAPSGIQRMYSVAIADPSNKAGTRFAYVALAKPGGPTRQFDASTGYVNYQRDADAELYRFSESSYENYGNAPKGPYFDDTTEDGDAASNTCETASIRQRRPSDKAWITTDTYKFRYDGRWLMTELHIKQADGSYGPDVIDRWKARAFAQDPGSDTPCCGYEEEDTNWGGSSILMGERSGAVRTIRETWGADSGTNVIRRETFYRDQIQYASWLRVHVIPPLDGIYQQTDYNAGIMTKYYNQQVSAGVDIDGKNDEVLGNLDDPCNSRYDNNDTSDIDQTYRSVYTTAPLCNLPYHQSVDVMDPTFSAPGATLQWEQIGGPYGTLVDRWAINQITPGGAVQGVMALPYYRDDSCFDDGTGSDPGPKWFLRNGNEPTTYTDATGTHPRKCWEPSDGLPDPNFAATTAGRTDYYGDERYFQGDIGANGLHLMFQVDSDNASLTVPVTEISAVQRQVILQGVNLPNVGDFYGRWSDFPLTAVTALYA